MLLRLLKGLMSLKGLLGMNSVPHNSKDGEGPVEDLELEEAPEGDSPDRATAKRMMDQCERKCDEVQQQNTMALDKVRKWKQAKKARRQA